MPKPQCETCGLDEKHDDVADCMRDLMRYVLQDIRDTPQFQRALTVGYEAMKIQLKTDPIPSADVRAHLGA